MATRRDPLAIAKADALVAPAAAALSTAQAALLEGVADKVRAARSTRTQQLYAREWGSFTAWCTLHGFAALPAAPTSVAMYLELLDRLGRKPATIDLALSAICARHRAAVLPNPRDAEIVRLTRAGVRRTRGVKPKKVHPLVVDELREVIAMLPDDSLAAVRDKALLLVGFAAALRESELVALNVADIEISKTNMVLSIGRSKTDQEGLGALLGIRAADDPALCAIGALSRWLALGEVRDGPIWRGVDRWENVSDHRLSVRSIDLIVKRSIALVGLDRRDYAGHSLRAGLATSAADAGKSLDAIMRQTRHKSVEVARGYIRRADLFKENVLDGLI